MKPILMYLLTPILDHAHDSASWLYFEGWLQELDFSLQRRASRLDVTILGDK